MLPVVASRVGSIPEVIQDRENGILIEPADAVELAAGIDYILGNREATARIAESALETVGSRFTVDRMVSDYEALFDNVAGD